MRCLFDDASNASVRVAKNEHWNKINCEKVEQRVELLFGRRVPVLIARNDLRSGHGFVGARCWRMAWHDLVKGLFLNASNEELHRGQCDRDEPNDQDGQFAFSVIRSVLKWELDGYVPLNLREMKKK